MRKYDFRRMVANDLPLVRRWATSPEVAPWWRDINEEPLHVHDPEAFQDALGDLNIAPWIVSYANRAFAYIQDYDPRAWPNHHFSSLPLRSRGVDQFIGDPHFFNQGHGSAFIREHVDALFARGAPAAGTDPHPTNARAIRAYEKAGFMPTGERHTKWGRALMMIRFNR